MELIITAKPRAVRGRQNRKLRRSGMLPAVLYGPKQEATALQVSAREFARIYKAAGESTLVNLAIEGQGGRKKVLIHDVARHFMKNEPIHADFYEVDLTRKIHAKIPAAFTGVSAAVKELGGVLVKNLTEIEVEALPTNLPREIEISLEKLATFEDSIRLSDVKVAGDVKILGNLDEVVAAVQPPRSEEELKELEKPTTAEAEAEAVAAVAPEEKPAEGEAAAAAAEGGEKQAETKAEAPAKAEKPKEEKK